MKYFDYAATTPMSEEAIKTFVSVSQKYYANTNSLHEMGEQSKQLYDQCRTHLGSLIGSNPDQLFFTKGGSEANILAIESLLKRHHGKHIIVSQAEHNSIIEMCHQKEREGYNVTYLSFNQNGQVDLTELNSELRYDTAVVIVQHVNGEIGTIQPVEEIANICKQNGVFFHVDAVQSFGRLKLSHLPERVDSLSVSSHKVYGPKGVGLLYLNEANNKGIERLLLKGNTIDLPSVAAFTVAAYEIIKQQTFEETRLSKLRNQLINELEVIHNDLTIYDNTDQAQIPSIIGLGINGIEGQWVMLECNRNGFAISTGSACDVKYNKTANALKALSVTAEQGKEFFRISLGTHTTEEDIISLSQFLIKMTKDFKGGKVSAKTENDSR